MRTATGSALVLLLASCGRGGAGVTPVVVHDSGAGGTPAVVADASPPQPPPQPPGMPDAAAPEAPATTTVRDAAPEVTAPPPDASPPPPDAAPPPVLPPMPDPTSAIPISRPGAQYTVEGNIVYGPLPQQRLDVMYPTNAGPRGTRVLPGVIMFHGGGWIETDKASMSSFFTRFLAHGFLVCNVEYRMADGTPNGAIAPAAVQDALLAAKWFWDHLDYYHVDRARYVVTGASAGGHLGMMVGMATPAANLGPTSPANYKIAAIINGYGPPDVADLLARGTSWALQWLPPTAPDHDALVARVSPITYVRRDLPPFITVQGSDDTTVPVAENQQLDQLLRAAGVDASLHLVPGAGHGFTTPATAWPDAEATMVSFLVAHGIIAAGQ